MPGRAERVGSDAAAALVVQTKDCIASIAKEANRLAMHAGRKTLKGTASLAIRLFQADSLS